MPATIQQHGSNKSPIKQPEKPRLVPAIKTKMGAVSIKIISRAFAQATFFAYNILNNYHFYFSACTLPLPEV
jgi:hypothetical protein